MYFSSLIIAQNIILKTCKHTDSLNNTHWMQCYTNGKTFSVQTRTTERGISFFVTEHKENMFSCIW